MTKFNNLFTLEIKYTGSTTIFTIRKGNHHMYKINFKQPIHVHFIGIGEHRFFTDRKPLILLTGLTVSYILPRFAEKMPS